MDIILASASPRRKELLGFITEKFECIPADIDETLPENISADDSAEYLARLKAEHIAASHPNSIVIGCDTVVVYNSEVFGKPVSEEDAELMLNKLSGNVHKVITGVSICCNERKLSFSEITEVEFFELTEKEITDYIAGSEGDKREWEDKAGGYAIQGVFSKVVKRIHGDYYSVMGLPVARLYQELKKVDGDIKFV